MIDVPGFLLTLGLRQDVDERAVRQAYARELKKLDQDIDALAFQQLREGYEAALQSIRLAPVVESDSAAPPSVASQLAGEPDALTPELPSVPKEDGAAQAMTALRQRLTLDPVLSVLEARQVLDQALEDSRLLTMDARVHFEAGVADLLASGWRPGHEHVFEAALAVFEWRSDSARLQRIGHAGWVVDRAIVEQHAQGQQRPGTRDSQLKFLALLRSQPNPEPQTLALGLEHVLQAASAFPHWVRITTDSNNIECWCRLEEDSAQSIVGSSNRSVVAAGRVTAVWLVVGFVTFIAITVMFWVWKSELDRSVARPPAASVALAARSQPASPSPSNTAVDRAAAPRRTSNGTDADYLTPPRPLYPPMSKRFGEEGKVVVRVLVKSDGSAGETFVARSSGMDRLDRAALEAVKAARFRPALGLRNEAIDAWFNAPVNFQLTDKRVPAAAQPSYGQVITAAIRPQITFTDVIARNPAAEVTVDLDADGKVMAKRLTHSSGVASWDAAVLRAIERTPRIPADAQGHVPPILVISFRPKVL